MAEVTQIEFVDTDVIVKKTSKDLENFVLSFAEDALTKRYRNGYIVHVHFSNGKILTKTADTLVQYFQESDNNYVINKVSAKSSVYSLLNKLKRHKINIARDWHLIEDLLLQPVHVPVSNKRKLLPDCIQNQNGDNVEEPALNSPHIKILSTDCRECLSLRDESQIYIADRLGDTNKKAGQQQQSAHPHQSTEKQLKTDCVKCSTMRKSYSQAISELRVKLRASRKRLKEISKTYNIRVINKTLKRKDVARQRLRCERKALRKENSKLKNEIKRLKSVVLQRIFKSDESETYKIGDDLSQINLELEINNITKEIKSREERIQQLGLEVDSLRCELNKLQQCSNTAMEITPGDSRLKLHSQRCDEDVTMMPKYDDRSVGKVPRFKQGEGTSKKRWIEVEKCTDIPANVAIEIEDQTHITCLDNGALELWNHKSSGYGTTNPADIFSVVKIEISKLAFKSINGKYWSLQTDGRVVSTAETVGDREHFEPVFKDGKVAFIGYNNCFLSHNDDGDIVCLSSSADPKIWFKLRSHVARTSDPLKGDFKGFKS